MATTPRTEQGQHECQLCTYSARSNAAPLSSHLPGASRSGTRKRSEPRTAAAPQDLGGMGEEEPCADGPLGAAARMDDHSGGAHEGPRQHRRAAGGLSPRRSRPPRHQLYIFPTTLLDQHNKHNKHNTPHPHVPPLHPRRGPKRDAMAICSWNFAGVRSAEVALTSPIPIISVENG